MKLVHDILGQAAKLKSALDKSIEKRKRNWIAEKESNLSVLQRKVSDEEAELAQIESRLITQELALKQRRRIPFLTFILCTAIAGASVKYVNDHYEMEPRSAPAPSPTTYTPSSVQSPTRAVDTTSVRSGPSGQTLLNTYNGIDMDHGDFDVGGYCLNQEKMGAMTFEECIVIAMAKARNKIDNNR